MTEINNETKTGVCAPEGTASPERAHTVIDEAFRFNRILQEHKAWTWGDVDIVEKEGDAFHRELAELPIAERRILANVTNKVNEAMKHEDPEMPTTKIDIDRTAFISSFEIHSPHILYLKFAPLGQCTTESVPWRPEDQMHY